MDFSAYIDTELYATVPLLYAIGSAIKKSSINDKWIPLILGAMGILFALAYKLAAGIPAGLPESLLLIASAVSQGILCAAASVYANNLLKQLKKDEKDSNSNENSAIGNS